MGIVSETHEIETDKLREKIRILNDRHDQLRKRCLALAETLESVAIHVERVAGEPATCEHAEKALLADAKVFRRTCEELRVAAEAMS